MFQQLSDRLNKVIKTLTGQGRLTEKNIEETLREIRIALLEADVALPVAKAFIQDIQEKAVGKEVIDSLTPGQALVKIVHDELKHLFGEKNETLNLKTTPPAVILMAGLQGSGKTTTAAKLALLLKNQHKKKVMLASADIYRPAAITQLQVLAKQIEVEWFQSAESDHPTTIANKALQAAKNQVVDVLILDTAGRLHIDQEMMSEIKALHAAIDPIETLFVVDSMTGQDAANTAKAFNDALPLTGVILTKIDGDTRGGAALSIRQITGKPIKFIGVGEKITALDPFHPDRLASRILGMGDIVSLAEEAAQKLDHAKAEKLAKKIKKGHGFDLEDFRDQLKQIQNMGGMTSILAKLPGLGAMQPAVQNAMDSKKLVEIEAIINSMTPKERHFPDNIRHSQKTRIANGSGTSIQAVNQLLKQFTQMQKMMKKMQGGGMMKMMRMMHGKFGQMGGGMFH